MMRVVGIFAIVILVVVVGLVFVARAIVPGATEAQPQLPEFGTHVVDVPFFQEWAGSGHADILAAAFRHWEEDGAVPTSCATCHTSGGFHDFLGVDGSPAGSVESEVQPSIITCAGCHAVRIAGDRRLRVRGPHLRHQLHARRRLRVLCRLPRRALRRAGAHLLRHLP